MSPVCFSYCKSNNTRESVHNSLIYSCLQEAKLPKVIRSELFGYDYIRKQYESAIDRQSMNMGVIIFTIIFSIMCFENVFRVADFIGAWTYPVVEEEPQPDNLSFSSS